MPEIKRIDSALPMNGTFSEVGVGGVTEIRDLSDEWESGPQYIYEIYVDRQLFQRIENMPVVITYFLVGDSND